MNRQRGMKLGQILHQSWGNKKSYKISYLGNNKTLKNCKDKTRNFCYLYKIAKDQNKTTRENFHSLPYFETFDEKPLTSRRSD